MYVGVTSYLQAIVLMYVGVASYLQAIVFMHVGVMSTDVIMTWFCRQVVCKFVYHGVFYFHGGNLVCKKILDYIIKIWLQQTADNVTLGLDNSR